MASKNKVLKFQKPRVEKKMKFLPTVLGKTLQILLGKGRWREVLLAVRAPRLPVRGPSRRSLFLRFSGCFASVFPSSHSSRSPASLVSQPCVKVGKNKAYPETAAEQVRRTRREEENPAADEAAGGKASQRGASTRTSSPRNHVILGGRVWNTQPVRR